MTSSVRRLKAEQLGGVYRTSGEMAMLHTSQVEELVTMISTMNRSSLIEQFRSYPARFPLDLTDDFLNSASVERLRHIFLAVCLQNQKMPFREAVAA